MIKLIDIDISLSEPELGNGSDELDAYDVFAYFNTDVPDLQGFEDRIIVQVSAFGEQEALL